MNKYYFPESQKFPNTRCQSIILENVLTDNLPVVHLHWFLGLHQCKRFLNLVAVVMNVLIDDLFMSDKQNLKFRAYE